MKVASFFAGCGGLDLGFEQAGYKIVWANEFDSDIYATYELNHPNTMLCKKSIKDVLATDIPNCDGFIGGPPCQAWSEAGKGLGLNDERGQVFLDYIRLIKDKQPKFFLIENVKGLISEEHIKAFDGFISTLHKAGYNIRYQLLDAIDFLVPQNRERVFIVGVRNDIKCQYKFPNGTNNKHLTLRDAISDIECVPNIYTKNSKITTENIQENTLCNHDVYIGPYSERYMARNRVRAWNEPSFTIPASAANVPLHPQAPKMTYISYNKRMFMKGQEKLYRRLSIRECARIQTFPDHFRFVYQYINNGYKMVGNAVPPRLAKALAISLLNSLNLVCNVLIGYVKDERQLAQTRNYMLYYIRKGNRVGALSEKEITNIDYVLLHDLNHKYFFSVSKHAPTQCDANYLKSIGFNPFGNEYWCFNLLTELDLSSLGSELDDSFVYSSKKPRLIKLTVPI